ncbi:MAG: hypothetical protein VKL59_16840 [Nostocaceae cyanobacterium]|nr:hypothetical protein [Nostocaceae cyanobacterium]
MKNQTGLIAKLLIYSLAISIFIKYAAPVLDIADNTTNAVIAILSPTIILAIALWWRFRKQQGMGNG